MKNMFQAVCSGFRVYKNRRHDDWIGIEAIRFTIVFIHADYLRLVCLQHIKHRKFQY